MTTDRDVTVSIWQRLALLVALGALWVLAITEMTASPIIKDAAGNLQLALNLAHHGIVSLDVAPPYRPSMMREPVPVAVLAGTVLLTDSVTGNEQSAQYFSGARARSLKYSNLLWLTLLAVCTFLAVRHFTSKFAVALLGGVLVALHFTAFVPVMSRQYLGVDNLDTELAGAAVLTTASLLLAVGVARRSRLTMALSGLSFGLAALTKAALFYVCIGGLGAFALYYAISMVRGEAKAPRQTLFMGGALAAAFLVVSLSWAWRNHVQTGFFQIAERSGSVLMHRALLDEMTPRELVGAFGVWGEYHTARIVSRLTGFTEADLDAGGRLQRLSERLSGPAEQRELLAEESGRPQDAITWYRKARAVYEAKLAQVKRAGHSYPSGAADLATRNEAIGLIAQHPLKHAAVMPLLIWRGATWTFPVFVIAFIYAARRGRPDLLLFVLPAIGLALFYAAVSQFSARFGYVLYPIAIVAVLTLGVEVFHTSAGARKMYKRRIA